MLPVLDTKKQPIIILEDNIIRFSIDSPIAPKAIIIEDNNNNEDDNNNKSGDILGVQDNIGNPGVRNADKISYNNYDSQTPGVKY